MSGSVESPRGGFTNESDRIVSVYRRRNTPEKQALYAWHRPDVLLAHHCFHSLVAGELHRRGLDTLQGREILDVGCGRGGWLRLVLEWGAEPERLHGTDIFSAYVEHARRLAPNIDYRVSDSWPLPFAGESMDLVSMHGVLSSILDAEARRALAQEVVRVTRPAGLIVVSDFRFKDPRNPDTVSIRPRDVRRLFPGMTIEARPVLLAPPILRPLAGCAPTLALVVDALLPFLRSHVCYFIAKP